jgi:hypothetical protein
MMAVAAEVEDTISLLPMIDMVVEMDMMDRLGL